MINRKKKLKLIQLTLLILGIVVIFTTYYKSENVSTLQNNNKLVSEDNQNTVKNNSESGDVFFNIEYTGLDLNGNRYILKSAEAQFENNNPEIVNMKVVHATFYFKDSTTLSVWSDEGIYNNRTLDMEFSKNVKADYLDNKLFAEKANYSNSENYLSIYENVRINSEKGDLIADKLLFDIIKQNLDITSFKNNKVNANLKLNEKRF